MGPALPVSGAAPRRYAAAQTTPCSIWQAPALYPRISATAWPQLLSTGFTYQRSIEETRMNLVEVFKFEHVDEHNNATVRAPRMATLAAIQRVKGVTIESTIKIVDKSKLDGNGFYPKK
jgi:hypothetical protein